MICLQRLLSLCYSVENICLLCCDKYVLLFAFMLIDITCVCL